MLKHRVETGNVFHEVHMRLKYAFLKVVVLQYGVFSKLGSLALRVAVLLLHVKSTNERMFNWLVAFIHL